MDANYTGQKRRRVTTTVTYVFYIAEKDLSRSIDGKPKSAFNNEPRYRCDLYVPINAWRLEEVHAPYSL